MTSEALGAADPNERIEVSVMLKPRHSLDELAARRDHPLSREEFAASFGADPADVQRVESFAREHHFDVVESSPARRTIRLAGRSADLAEAFGVTLQRQRGGDGTEFRATSGPVQMPAELADSVQAVFGLDTRPIARPRG